MYVDVRFVRSTYVGELALHGFNHNIYHTHLKKVNTPLFPGQTNKQTNKHTIQKKTDKQTGKQTDTPRLHRGNRTGVEYINLYQRLKMP